MKKCYIAGKIGNIPKEEYTRKFCEAENAVYALGYEPVNPVALPHNHGRTWAEYMCEDIAAMLGCDAVFALRDWRQSPGAVIELELALKLGKTIFHQM